MIKRFAYVVVFFGICIFGSFSIQSGWHRPPVAIKTAEEFKLSSVKFCVSEEQPNYLTISVKSGEFPRGTLGKLIDRQNILVQGDCLSALVQVSPAKPFERFAFRGTLKQIQGQIAHSRELAPILAMRDFLRGVRGDPENLIAGLAVGIDSGLSESFKQNMKTTGLTHLTAVSGANCAIVLGMVWLLLRMFGIGRGVRTVASLLVLTGYVVLVGWQPSVLRSAFMMGIVFISLELGKRVWIPGVLIIGSLTLLVVDPWLTFEYGFWLSVLATFGLVILTPKLSEKFQRQLPKWLAVTLAATLSAQLWCLPLLVELQGGFSTHSILANLLVEPAVPIITVLGLLAAISGPIVPLVGGFMLHLAAVPAGWIVWVANSLAQAPIELLPISGNLVGFILTALFSTFVTLAIKKGKMRFALVPLSLSALWLGSLGGQAVKQIGFNLSDWSVLSCDVGQGDATLLRSSNQLAVIDVGRDPMLIDGCLDQQGIQSIDLLVLTHFDQDHVGGLPGLLNGRSISRVLISRFPDERPDALALIAELRNLNLELISAPEGLTGKLGNFTWEVISSLGNEGESANEASLGIKFESSALVIYTLADMNERAQERILRKASGSRKPTLVKVSHHGSADQCSEFYDRIDADVALISVGKGNSYGHPTKSALNMLAKTSTRVFRTDLQGAIAVKVSDGVIEVKTSGAR